MKDLTNTVQVYLKKDNSYLLLYRNKKKNDINEGKWIGVGGHVEKGETPDMAMIREVKEETGLDVISYKYRGLVHFASDDYKEVMYLYTVDAFKGELIECDEGTLRFVPIKDLLTLPMWEGDKIFLKKMLSSDECFELELKYQKDKLISYKFL